MTQKADSAPLLLDLFCGAGGAAMGYHRAGFDVVGVDVAPQPHYPFRFVQGDALDPPVDLRAFDAIHASPPCQDFSAYGRARETHERGNLIPATRALLTGWGGPWVIENVEGAPLRVSFTLCGSAVGLLDIRRHRWFESSVTVLTPPCSHGLAEGSWPASTNRRPNSRRTIAIGQWNVPLADQQLAMGVDWMTLEELSEAVPPAYTEFIGQQLLEHLRRAA